MPLRQIINWPLSAFCAPPDHRTPFQDMCIQAEREPAIGAMTNPKQEGCSSFT